MPQDVRSTTPTTPLTALLQRWWIAVILVVIGGAAGAGFAYVQPTTYTGEARVTVGSESLDARVVAGYATAANQLASDISRYVNDQQAQDALAPVLGDIASDVSSVAASPISGSSVIRVEVEASSEAAAIQGAQLVAEQLATQVNAVSGETSEQLLQQYTDLSNQVATAQVNLDAAKAALASLTGAEAPQPDIEAARGAVTQGTTALDVLQIQQQALGQRYRTSVTNTPAAAGLRVVQDGQLERTDASSRMQQYGLAGVVGGAALALLVAVLLDRGRAARARRAARFAAGAPVTGSGRKRPTSPVKPSGKSRDTTLDLERTARAEPRQDVQQDSESQASRP